MERLSVWAEHIDGFVLVGTLALDADGQEWFAYDEAYLRDRDATPIYPVLPLQDGHFGTSQTRAAFSSLSPEGPVGRDIRIMLRAGRDAVTPVLARLDHETVGALTFTPCGDEPSRLSPNGQEIGESFFNDFAASPERTALATMLESRLSLNGAVSKVGLALHDSAWFIPQGLNPSTHILKSGSGTFHDQMLNECLCMRCAMGCGFDDAAKTELIVVEGHEPLLVSQRFDRLQVPDRPHGLPSTMRLHQADLCQVMGIAVDGLKYTPSDELVANYNTSVADAISRESTERYGDRSYVFEVQVFNYLIGNCDNHLKNLSMTWQPDWSGKSVSPIYDITCTTIYEDLSRDMGLGIGRHRAIDEIDTADFNAFARQLGIGNPQARWSIAELAHAFEPALMSAARDLEEEYGVAAVALAEKMLEEGRARRELALRAAEA